MEYSKEVLERAKKAVEIYNAILEGKEIEIKNINGDWVTLKGCIINIYDYEYRVKPDVKYVPFTFQDAKDLIRKVICHKCKKKVAQINVIYSEYIGIDADNIRFERLLQDFEFLDGSPCGKLENQ
jgi:hypothetical protein